MTKSGLFSNCRSNKRLPASARTARRPVVRAGVVPAHASSVDASTVLQVRRKRGLDVYDQIAPVRHVNDDKIGTQWPLRHRACAPVR